MKEIDQLIDALKKSEKLATKIAQEIQKNRDGLGLAKTQSYRKFTWKVKTECNSYWQSLK